MARLSEHRLVAPTLAFCLLNLSFLWLWQVLSKAEVLDYLSEVE